MKIPVPTISQDSVLRTLRSFAILRLCSLMTQHIPVLTRKLQSRFSKFSVFTVFAFLISISTSAQSEPNYKFLKGRVKSCNEQCYKAKGLEGYVDKTMHKRPVNSENDFEIQYDSLGKKLQKIEFDGDGQTVLRKHFFTYDGHNQLAEIRTVSNLGTLILSTQYWNSIDSAGRLVARYVDYSDQTKPAAYTYSYSTSGTVREYFHPKDSFPQKQLESREFDSAGNVIKYWSYSQNGKLLGSAVLSYDTLGNKIEEKMFDKNGHNYLIYSWKYAGGHDPERYEICQPGSTSCESWTYKYEYDKTGNWIRRTEYRNGKLVYLTERKFTYW